MFLEALFAHLHALLAALLVASPSPTLCHLQDTRIQESSGVAVSPGVLWTHNDSGDTARFFALDRHCRTLATYDVTNETARDWEDMARGGGYLWFGDIGDNRSTRTSIAVVRVPEPHVSPGSHAVMATVFRFTYPDGPHDAETLLLHPRTGQLYFVTKTLLGPAGVYAAPLHPSVGKLNPLTEVGTVSAGLMGTFTSGDINADATRLVLRTYSEAFEWRLDGGDVVQALKGTPTVTDLPPTDQGEAIAYDTDGRSWITTSEGKGAPVDRVAR
jgi:hypothetical protein